MGLEITQTTLPNNTIGDCGLFNNTSENTILTADANLISGRNYTFSLWIKAEVPKQIKMVGGTDEIKTLEIGT